MWIFGGIQHQARCSRICCLVVIMIICAQRQFYIYYWSMDLLIHQGHYIHMMLCSHQYLYSYYHHPHNFSFHCIFSSIYKSVRFVTFDRIKFPKLYIDLLNEQLINICDNLIWFLFYLTDQMISFNCLFTKIFFF